MKAFISYISLVIAVILSFQSSAQTCSDGIQNGTETGIDCGGNCAPCSTPCNVELTYTLGGPPVTPTYISMTGGTINTCSGVFCDPGGPTGQYANSSNYTQTICSDDPGVPVTLTFTDFALESGWDYLYVYDGPNTSSALLGQFTGSGSPGVVTASGSCITIQFTSDGSVILAGWQAEISCGPILPPTLDCTGGEITLTASGQGASYIALNNDFDFGTAGSGWTTNVAASFNNPCDPPIDGGTYMWMGNSAQHPRIIQTVPLDLSCGGEICFYLDFATQGLASPCEGIDLAGEGVFFDYSIDGGNTWITLEYFGPGGAGDYSSDDGYDAQMTAWNQYCYDVPAAAETPTTIIRWAQTGSSGLDYDHWGIDNVTVSSVINCAPYTYDYTFLPPAVDNNVQTVNITSTTTYTVTYGNGTDECTATITIPVPPCGCPTADVSGGGNYCAGDDVPDVVFDIVGGTAPFTLTYAIDGVSQPPLTVFGSDTMLINPVDGQYTIVAITDPTACVGTFSGSADVATNPAPVLNSFTGEGTYCEGEVVDDLIIVASGNGTLTIDYTLDGVAQTPVSGSSPFNIGNAPGVYNLTALSDQGCTTPIDFTQTIVVTPNPVATAGTTTPVICAGQTISLTGNTTPGTYSWTGPNNFTSTNEDPTIINVTVATTGTYTLIITNNGCVSAPSTVDVTVNPSPVVTANPDQTICEGTPVTLTALGADTYSWSGGIQNGVSFIPGTTTTYTVTGTSNGCTDSETVTITVLPLPVALGSANINSGYPPLTVVFSNQSTNATDFTWDFGNSQGVNTQNATPISSVYGAPGTYTVVLTASNGLCDSTWTDIITVIPYPELIVDVPNVFSPNGDGSNEAYFVSVINGKSFEASILNRWGNVMFEMSDLNQGWDGKVNGSDAAEGVYFVVYKVEGLDGTVKEGHTFFHLVR